MIVRSINTIDPCSLRPMISSIETHRCVPSLVYRYMLRRDVMYRCNTIQGQLNCYQVPGTVVVECPQNVGAILDTVICKAHVSGTYHVTYLVA